MKNRASSVACRVALALAGAFAMAADAATGPTAVPRGRVPIKGDFGETVTVRADASGFTGTHDVSGGDGYYDKSTGEDHRGGEGRYRLMPPKGGMKLILR